MIEVRLARAGDFVEVSGLIGRYMAETYADSWHGNLASLTRDGLGTRFHMLIAVKSTEITGVVACEPAYDLHHCIHGGHVLDLYVVPAYRGRGVALQLLAATCRHIHNAGGEFLRGHSVESGSAAKLYDRVAAKYGHEHILGGRAFLHLAKVRYASVRELARQIPDKDWNFQSGVGS